MNMDTYRSHYKFEHDFLKDLKVSMQSYQEYKYGFILDSLQHYLTAEGIDDAARIGMAMATIQAFLDVEKGE